MVSALFHPMMATARARITQFAEANNTLRCSTFARTDALRDSAAQSGPAFAASSDLRAAIRNSTFDRCGSSATSGHPSVPC